MAVNAAKNYTKPTMRKNLFNKIKKTGTVTSVTQRLLDSIERRLTNRNKKKK